MPDIHLDPGSAADVAVRFLHGNADEFLDRAAAAAKLGIGQAAVDRALQPAVDQGLITVANEGEYGRVWRAGPRLKHWTPPAAGAGVPKQPTATAAKPKDPRGGVRPRLPVLDAAHFPVRKDVPVPVPEMSRPGKTRYDALFSEMTADGMSRSGLPMPYRQAVTKAGQTYLKNRPELAKACTFLFRAEPGKKTFGIWRVARTDTAAIRSLSPTKPSKAA